MNLDLDLSALPRFFRGIATELRQKRLWPVAAVLVAALIAVPVLLASSSSAPAPQPQAQVPTPPPAPGSSLPAINVTSTPTHSHVVGPLHDPFSNGTAAAVTPPAGATASTPGIPTSTATSTATSNTTSTLTGGASSTGSSVSSPASGTATGVPANPPSITHGAKPKPAPSGLKPTQAYDVSLAITNSTGGIDTTDPLERLSVIPSDQQPLLVELGVAQDGNHVLFVVQHGAVPSGPGTCIPGPVDCEILSLGQDQTERLSAQTGSIGASQVALFAVTSITANDYPSADAAARVRRRQSSAGHALLQTSSYQALSLFQYEPGFGSVVDLRNLKVGG
jgi:hypothetical protein